MITRFLLVYSLMVGLGCTTTLKPGAEKVMLSEKEPASSCAKIGQPHTFDLYSMGSTDEQNKNTRDVHFKNTAFDENGNYVKIEHPSKNRTVGIVFRCP